MEQHRHGSKKGKRPWWYLGGIAVYLLTAGKNLLGLLKLGKVGAPLISMFVSLGAYALVFPFAFAAGLIVMLLIHELGHVLAAKRKGLPVSAPLFIPFLGALITLKRNPRDAETEAYVALGGPLLGSAGALLAFVLGMYFREPSLIVAAKLGFFLNLINLLPIHPLDGGRIATAVTRWLWLVGLVGGLYVIYYLGSILFLFIWLLFAWELLQKFVLRKGKQARVFSFSAEANLQELAAAGVMLPGKEHRRELAFVTSSSLDGQQKVTALWEGLDIRQTVLLPEQGVIRKVYVTGIDYLPTELPEKLVIHGRIEYERFENDKYYEVSPKSRIVFGAAYLGLAAVLGYMLYVVQQVGFYNQYIINIAGV